MWAQLSYSHPLRGTLQHHATDSTTWPPRSLHTMIPSEKISNTPIHGHDCETTHEHAHPHPRQVTHTSRCTAYLTYRCRSKRRQAGAPPPYFHTPSRGETQTKPMASTCSTSRSTMNNTLNASAVLSVPFLPALSRIRIFQSLSSR